MRRGNILPVKGLVYKALGLTSLFPTEGSGDNNTQGFVNTINIFNGLFTKETLVRA